ncbi:MAG: RIP metalloprotease RseP [Thermoflavifilum sp.]|nr:RIP metalloprotease RseP [Thermoflavifilum sp.]
MTTTQILIKVAQLMLSLSILVIWHELGHFIPAKLFKTKVEKFYLFFNPWFSLFKFKRGETEYGIGWLPLGGYVKIAGMIDESLDKDQLQRPPQPWEFRAKPAWQRLIIMVGGVLMNVILAFMIYVAILWVWGETYLPPQNLTYGLSTGPLAQQIGLRDGDRIMAVDGKPIDNVSAIPYDIIVNQAHSIQLDRNGVQISLPIPPGFIEQMVRSKGKGFVSIRMPVIVDTVLPSARFLEGKLMKGDRIISVNGRPTPFDQDFQEAVKGLKNTTVVLGVLRQPHDTSYVKARINDQGLIGFGKRPPDEIFHFETKHYSFWTSIPAGIHKGLSSIGSYLQQLKLIFFSKEVKTSDSLGGFITIGNLFPAFWDWQAFWSMTAFLSIILAVMNILPIPALDGGHVLFLLYEIVTRRKPSEKFLEYAQIAGMIILFALLLYANGLDIWRHLTGR